MADANQNRPEGMETKSTGSTLPPDNTRNTVLGYIPSTVPNTTRTGGELTEEEQRIADIHGDLAVGGSGLPEADARNLGMLTETGGTQRRGSISDTMAQGERPEPPTGHKPAPVRRQQPAAPPAAAPPAAKPQR